MNNYTNNADQRKNGEKRKAEDENARKADDSYEQALSKENKQLAKALRAAEERYEGILSSITEGYYETDLKGNITFCNEATANLLGYNRREDITGKNYQLLLTDSKAVLEVFSKVFRTGRPERGFTMEITKKDGSTGLFELSVSPMYNEKNIIIGFRGVGRDVTERKLFEEKLRYLSFHDQLTDLYNRTFFEEELQRLEKSRNYPVSIISADLDGLKLVNDAIGHKSGDELLKACAKILEGSIRKADMVARIGGDEFAIILPCTDEWVAENIINRIHQGMDDYNSHNGNIYLSISLGVATAMETGSPLEEILREADNYMYREKISKGHQAYDRMVKVFLETLGKKDYMEKGHGQRMEQICRRLGERMKLSARQVADLRLLAKVHDLGKVGIEDHLLTKATPLTDDEWKAIKEHAEKGHRIALSIRKYTSIADLILRHHEWWNGKGYPIGLKGNNIPIECRILAVADAYDAMTNERPYRKAMTREEAIAELKACADIQFDPRVVREFISLSEEEDI